MTEAPPMIEAVFVARQPVFHADETLWGYELLFRSGEGNVANVTDGSQATASVIADGLALAMEGMSLGMRILINFPEQLLVDDVGFALPKEACIVEILEDVNPTPEALAAARRLKDAGYTLAVDDYAGQPELLPFLKMADILKVDVLELGNDMERVRRTLEALPVDNIQLLAEKVEDKPSFLALRDMGFNLFQGFFFSMPEILPGKKLSTNEVTKLQLLSELSAPEFEPKRLAEILESDPSLSYRLFRYINSVGFGLRKKVTSLKRAIDMMGLIQAKQWLRTAILSDLNPAPTAGELAFMSVHRAKFLESLCGQADLHRECRPDTMFITGLFSLLDAMLGVEMGDILEKLPLDESVTDVLCGEEDSLLPLVRSYEHGQWADTLRLLAKLGLPPDQADLLYAQSGNWAQRMVGFSRTK
jgi:EAL and modified HD-GYP domain-containing signal transduction protein